MRIQSDNAQISQPIKDQLSVRSTRLNTTHLEAFLYQYTELSLTYDFFINLNKALPCNMNLVRDDGCESNRVMTEYLTYCL